MKKLFALFGLALAVLLVLGGCPTDSDPDAPKKPDPIPGLTSGTATKSADGFAALPDEEWVKENGSTPGRQVSITVTAKDGYITDVAIDGPDESTGVGSLLIAKAPAIIKKKNSFEIKVEMDAISKASCTRDAIIDAGKAAVEEIKSNSN